MRPTVEQVRALISYNPETGEMRWREYAHGRPKDLSIGVTSGRKKFVALPCNGARKQYPVSWVAWLMYYGEWPTGNIGYANGNQTDHRILNIVALRDRPEMTPEVVAQRLSYDPADGLLRWRGGRKDGGIAGRVDRLDGYVRVRLCGKMMKAHRIAWAISYGEWPGADIDHVDGRRHNNRLPNLRLATRTQNAQNASAEKNTASGTKNITWRKERSLWVVRVQVDGRMKYVGSFVHLVEARRARNDAVSRLHGEFGRSV